MIVTDTNVIASLFLETASSARAERALRLDAEWAAPVLWRSELRNVLASLQRTQRLELDDALAIVRLAEGLMRPHEFAVDSDSVLRLASGSGCTAYDCEFVALAESLDVPLVSLDRDLLAAFEDRAVSLEIFTG